MALSAERQKQADEWPALRRRHNARTVVPAPELGIAFLIMNKCGGTAATHAIKDKHGVGAMNIAEYRATYPNHELVTMWRDPFERVESMYRWGQGTPPSEPEFFPNWDLGFREWVAELCSRPVDSWYDLHVASQTWLANIEGHLPAFVLAWNWTAFAGIFHLDGLVEQRNMSDHSIPCEWDDATRQLIADYYADDIHTWENL